MSDVDIDTLSVKELKEFIKSAGLTISGCVDKSDLRERAKEAQEKLAAGGGRAAAGGEEDVSKLTLPEVVALLEKTVDAPKPAQQQQNAEMARSCLEPLVEALMEGKDLQVPRSRLLAAVLGSLKLGLGGQGGLFTMSCMPLPFLLSSDDEEEDITGALEEAETKHDAPLVGTLLAGLGKFHADEDMCLAVMMSLQQTLACYALESASAGGTREDDEPPVLMQLLNEGLLPSVVRAMDAHPTCASVQGSGISCIAAVCGSAPVEMVVGIALGAGVMTPLLRMFTSFPKERDECSVAAGLLQALAKTDTGRRAAKKAGAFAAITKLRDANKDDPALQVEMFELGCLIDGAGAGGGKNGGKGGGKGGGRGGAKLLTADLEKDDEPRTAKAGRTFKRRAAPEVVAAEFAY